MERRLEELFEKFSLDVTSLKDQITEVRASVGGQIAGQIAGLEAKFAEMAAPAASAPADARDDLASRLSSRLASAGGVSAELPHQDVPRPAESRLRGGQQRLQPRLDTIRRVLLDSGEITQQEFARIESLMLEGLQVDSQQSLFHPSVLGRLGRPASLPGILGRMQSRGFAPVLDEGEAVVSSLIKELRDKGLKESQKKSESECSTFAKFWLKMEEFRVLSQSVAEREPDTFWALRVHTDCVCHIFATRDWPTAARYHALVWKGWADGSVDLVALSQSEEARAGFFASAVHSPSYLESVTSKASPARRPGAKKEHETDVYCSYHKLYYPAGAGHDTASCRAKQARGERP